MTKSWHKEVLLVAQRPFCTNFGKKVDHPISAPNGQRPSIALKSSITLEKCFFRGGAQIFPHPVSCQGAGKRSGVVGILVAQQAHYVSSVGNSPASRHLKG
eukprot:714872-Pelagomonas_calceolata.AAC.1